MSHSPGAGRSNDKSRSPWSNASPLQEPAGLRPPKAGHPALCSNPEGASGLLADLGQSLRQRCLIHRCRNVVAKVPKQAEAEVKAAFWSIFDDIDEPPGERAVAEATRRAREFAERYAKLYPKAAACLADDFASLTVHLRFPEPHWKRIRHSNFIERTFGESRRRVKVIGRLPGESSCLSLVWAVLDRVSRGWRGVTQTSETVRLLHDLRRQLLEPPVDLGARRKERPDNATAADSGALSA